MKLQLFNRWLLKDEELEKHNRAMDDLIAEQRRRESVEIFRRGWCINQATCIDADSPADVIAAAERIYAWVYGPHLSDDAPDPTEDPQEPEQ